MFTLVNVIANCSLPGFVYKHLWKYLETMTNYDKSPTQTWKRPTTWNPSPQKRFFLSPLFKCSSTRLKTQSWGPHVDPPKRTCHLGKTWWDDRDTHGCKFKKNWDWKIIYQPFCKGHPNHPSKIIFEGDVYEKSTSLALCCKLKDQSHSPFPTAKRCAMKWSFWWIFKVWKPVFLAQQAISTNDRRSTPGKVSKKPSHSPTCANL